MAEPGGASDARRRRVRSRAILAAVVLVVLLAAAGGALVLLTPRGAPPSAGAPSTWPSASPSASTSALLPASPAGAMNILVMGSDIRGNAREAMRDSWVQIPGHGESKINAALALGGPGLVVDTVSAMLSVSIDHWALLDFEGFKAITDALGGIDVDVPVAFTASFDTHHAFSKGTNHLDGQAALEFVRERYAFPDGDYQRVRDQQAFVRSLVTQLVTTGRVRGPVEAIAAVALAMPYLSTDRGLDATGIAALGYGLRGVDPSASAFFTLPTLGTGTSADGQSIVIPDYAGIDSVAKAIAADSLGAYAAAHGLP